MRLFSRHHDDYSFGIFAVRLGDMSAIKEYMTSDIL